jgi:hypothetical protein
VRNSAFDARNYFDHPTPAYPGRIPPFRRNEFGFTNGGPVYIPHIYDGRKRTFYFFQYQGIPPGAGHHAGDARAHCAERAGIDQITYPTAARTRSPSPSTPPSPPSSPAIRCPTT